MKLRFAGCVYAAALLIGGATGALAQDKTFELKLSHWVPPSHPLHRPVREMLHEVYDRYRRPVFIAETGIEGDARPSWLRYIGQEARAAAAAGVELEGLCLYPIIDYPG